MKLLTARTMRLATKALVAIFLSVSIFSLNISPANAFAGTLENGNLAYAQSEFNKGAACNYLPGFESGYDAWHWILTTRGATFQQDPRNPAVAINLNIVYMRQDGSLFVIKSGAWVQTGKGAYTYTPVADRIRLVQAGSLALINGSDSGMRLSHTCPGTGSITATPTTSPTPVASPTPTVSSTPTATSTPTTVASPSPTSSPAATPRPTTSSSPTATATPTVSPSPSISPSPSLSPSPTTTPTSTVIPKLAPRPSARASAVQVRPTSTPNKLPTPKATPQAIESSPSPSPASTRPSTPTQKPTSSPTPTVAPEPTPTKSAEPSVAPKPTSSPSASPRPTVITPPVVPVPPVVEEPKNLVFVEPKTPTVIPPQSLPEPPASPIVITKEPEFGSVIVTPAGQITYTSNLTNPTSTTVDIVEITYTSLSGAVVVVRKEFILAQRGDVPSIIQTGYGNSDLLPNLWFGLLVIVIFTVVLRKRGNRNEA